MDAPSTLPRLLAILLASAFAWPASAQGLYKFIDSNGATVFTDVPPPSSVGIVEQAPIGATTGVAKPAGMPHYPIAEVDGAVTRANARVDGAEHDLALARQQLWSPHEGLNLAAEHATPAARARVEYYKKAVDLERQQLMDLLRERQVSPLLMAR